MATKSRGDLEDHMDEDVVSSSAATSGTEILPSATSEQLPWVEKYRPSSLDDLVSQNDIVTTISKLVDAKRLPHLLFYGPPGTGKTSTILALARKLYGSAVNSLVLELNASDDRGINVVRDQIKSFCSTRKLFSSGVKLVILDEADAMTPDAQFALRRVIEKYTQNARFCIICNYASKIIPALQSRCTRFRFSPLRGEDVRSRLQYVIDQEKLTHRVTDSGIQAILDLAEGDMRKVFNILQATASGFDRIDDDAVYECTGSISPKDLDQIQHSLLNDPFETAMQNLSNIVHTRGLALPDIVTGLSKRLSVSDLPNEVLQLFIEKLSDLEYRLAFGVPEKAQMASLVGAFVHARGRVGNLTQFVK